MRRPWRGAMPIALTLPLGLERRPRRRQTRFKRLALGALLLGIALLAAGYWLPARAEIAQRLLDRVAGPAPETRPRRDAGNMASLPRIATLAVGDELTIERPDGMVHTSEVTALDIVDNTRGVFSPDQGDDVAVLVAEWPFEAVAVGGDWRYVVTARKRF